MKGRFVTKIMSKLINDVKGITFDDVLVVPKMYNNKEIDISTNLTKTIKLKAPIISSPMDCVTESQMAIAVARQGGIGIVHDNMTIEQQAIEVDKVKRSEHGVITDPFSLSPNHYVYEANDLMNKFHISGVPVTENGLLVGIITNRDLKFEPDHSKKIYEVMTRENLITALEGTTVQEAKEILTKHKIEKLPLLDESGVLKGLITIKDIDKIKKYPNSAKDNSGRLLCAAKISISEDMFERIEALIEAKVDAIVLTMSHGHCYELINNIKLIKQQFPNLQIIAGNIATQDAAKDLIEAGADALVVGIGAGSICTTRIIAGSGIPQITAIMNVYEVAKNYDIPVLSDGGIKYSGDILKALVAGGSSVILGGMLAGCNESPGNIELFQGRKYKAIKGITKLPDIKTQEPKLFVKKKEEKFASESIEGRVSYKGPIKGIVSDLLTGLELGMQYSGSNNIKQLQTDTKFMQVTQNSNIEAHPFNVVITKESSNYTVQI